jgi:hypothetical protein
VAVDATLSAVPRPFPLLRGLTTRVSLTAIVGVSFAVRAVASAAHPVPRYFPDEYVYTAIARSLGAGHVPAVRGAAAHFPALLAPLLAAPLQALFSPELAYRLTQAENALLMSLAAVPVYLLARRLALSSRYALACAAFAVLIPDLVYSSYTLSDPVAYPLALAAVAAAVAAVARPTRRSQAAFLAFAGLAVFARVQYVVIPAAFVVAAVAADRRRVVRTQRLPLAVLALPVVGALAVGASRVLGYYSHVVHLHVGGSLLRWAVTDLFLLALSTGAVLVPGALVALARPRGRAQTAFSVTAAVFAAGLLLEAALYASNGSARFQERYLFALLPLVPVAFGLYLEHGRPARPAVGAIALLLLVASARVPVSGYAAAVGKTDSPFLFAVFRLERAVGTADGALIVALLAALGAVGAVAVSRFGRGRLALAGALVFVASASLGAIVNDAANAQQLRTDYLPRDPSWVDAAGVGPVTLVQTVGSPPDRAVEQLYWNRSVTREVRLGDARPTDVYPSPAIRVGRDGTLAGVTDSILFQGYAATARFQNATPVARAGSFTLWSGDSAPRLGLLEQGRFSDGWLMRSGRLTVWPDATGRVRGTLRFMLTLPSSAQPVVIRFGNARYHVAPGKLTIVTYTLDAPGRWSIAFSTRGGHWLDDLRSVSVQSTPPVLERAGAPEAPATSVS